MAMQVVDIYIHASFNILVYPTNYVDENGKVDVPFLSVPFHVTKYACVAQKSDKPFSMNLP